ncbi:Spore germination protein YndE [Sporomusa rhizae]|uniref:GerAB/ArcD/ProY family transporter n=1 Tax=Sporomusa rhizae TaxID=357999 RepID=UPI00352B5F5E
MNQRAGISLLQLFIIYISTAFGAGILSLPRAVGTVAKEDMWLSVFLASLVMGFSLWCAITLSERFPEVTLIEYHRLLLGPLGGQLLNICYVLILVILGAAALHMFTSAVKLFLFDLTPPYILVVGLLVTAAYAGQYGIAPLIRMQQFMVFYVGPFYITLVLSGFLRMDSTHLQPFLASGIIPVLKGVVPGAFAYTGPELVTGLLFPFVTRKKQVFKTGLYSTAMLAVLYTVITVIVQGALGPDEINVTTFPTITAYREVDIPGTFIERMDGYLLIVQIIFYFLSLANLLYFSAFGCSRLLQGEYSRPFVVLLIPVFFFVVTLPQNAEQINHFYRLGNYLALTWGVLILPGLLLIAKLRNLYGSKS